MRLSWSCSTIEAHICRLQAGSNPLSAQPGVAADRFAREIVGI